MQSVVFTNHARYQLLERGITEHEALSVLSAPQKTVQQSKHRFRVAAAIDERYALVVIYDETDTHSRVVTVFRTSKLSKYL